MNFILLILTFITIVAFQVPGLIRKQLWGELVAFSVLMLIGFGLAVLSMMGIKIFVIGHP